MKKRTASKMFGIILFVIGMLFLINSQANITGAIIGVSLSSGFSFIFGLIFVLVSSFLFISAEKLHITNTIDDLVQLGVPQDKIKSIQKKIRKNYDALSKDARSLIYQETADIIGDVKSGERVGGRYNLHNLSNIPHGLSNTLSSDVKILEGDAKVLSKYQHQKGRGTERYVFNSKDGELLGIAYHPHGDSTDLVWRVRF